MSIESADAGAVASEPEKKRKRPTKSARHKVKSIQDQLHDLRSGAEKLQETLHALLDEDLMQGANWKDVLRRFNHAYGQLRALGTEKDFNGSLRHWVCVPFRATAKLEEVPDLLRSSLEPQLEVCDTQTSVLAAPLWIRPPLL